MFRTLLAALALVVLASHPQSTHAQGGGRALPEVSNQGPAVRGSLDRSVIQRVIRRNIAAIRACYERTLARDPRAEGTVRVRFTIQANGRVREATTVDEVGLPQSMVPVARCVEREVMRWQFPEPPGGGIVVVTYPFAFRPTPATTMTASGGGGVGALPGAGGGSARPPGTGGMRSRPNVRSGSAEVSAGLSREVVRRVIRRHINEVRYCYERQLVRNAGLAGWVGTEFVIDAAGHVSTVSVRFRGEGLDPVANCIKRAVQRWRFPEPQGGASVRVRYPFAFSPS